MVENTINSNYISDVKTYYNQVGNKYSRFRKYFWSEARKFIDWTKSIYNTNSKLKFLDMGCGNGLYFQITTEYDSHGIDFSEKLIQISAKRYPYAKLKVGNVLETGYTDNEFDIILTVGVFQHLTNQEQIKFIQETIRILKIDGCAFISGMCDISDIPEINGLITFTNQLNYIGVLELIQTYQQNKIIEIIYIKKVQHSVIFLIKKI